VKFDASGERQAKLKVEGSKLKEWLAEPALPSESGYQ